MSLRKTSLENIIKEREHSEKEKPEEASLTSRYPDMFRSGEFVLTVLLCIDLPHWAEKQRHSQQKAGYLHIETSSGPTGEHEILDAERTRMNMKINVHL